MQPRVSKGERRLLLSYELPQRVHCAQLYPFSAPNGSTVVLYGHERGLRVLWRGGRRWSQRSSHANTLSNLNGADQNEVIMLDGDHEPQEEATGTIEGSEYEAEEEEQDSDCPYPNIIQDVDVELPSAVLHLAVPALATSSKSDRHSSTVGTVTVACADGSVTILQIFLAPPCAGDVDEYIASTVQSQFALLGPGSVPTGLASKLFSERSESDKKTKLKASRLEEQSQLVVATTSRMLHVWRVPITAVGSAHDEIETLPPQHLPSPTIRISFHPSQKSAQILLADRSGAVRIYDPFAPVLPKRRPSSSDSNPEKEDETHQGRWIMTYHTSFSPSPTFSTNPALVQPKKILDASWILNGHAILVLLDDGEWGIWDLTELPAASKRVESFSLRGFLGPSSAITSDSPLEEPKRKGLSKLAPMTPNTRKTKSGTIFAGSPKTSGEAAKGGIAVAFSSPKPGHVDESIVAWFGSNVYSILSMKNFWQRNASGNNSGSLFASGLSHITELNLMNENITSISQFPLQVSSVGTGQMNIQRDLLISTEYHLIVSQTLRSSTPSRQLFQLNVERPALRDQEMLDAGELDLGGMDRLLNSMAGAPNGKTRKVGFAR